MRKLVPIMVFILLAVNVLAVQVNYEEASKIAEMKLKIADHNKHSIADFHELLGEQKKILAYVFDLSPEGFIVTSTDTDITPVIAYSFRNNFSLEENNFNNGLIFLKGDMELRHEALDITSRDLKDKNNKLWEKYLSGDESKFLTRDVTWPPSEYGSPTGGWIEIQWNQSPNPYWTFCPMDPGSGSRTVVGCVATAMAQIMYFHRYLGNPVFNDGDDYWSTYTAPAIHLDNDHNLYDFPSYPELNPYLSDLASAFETNGIISPEMIAGLNFAAGVSVEMGYSSAGSGAYPGDVAPALLNKFDYDSASYTSNINSTFYTNLQNNLMIAQPAFFGIAGTDVGHAIICDGWNETDDTYHLNMGWGGYDDGWYSLPYGMPAGYNQITNAVINIDGGEPFIEVFGQVVAPGADLTDTIITLEGPRNYEIQVTDSGGFFSIPWVKGGLYQATAVIELENGGYFYKTYETELNESNTSLAFILDDYSTIDGTVSAAVNPENTSIAIYEAGQIVRMGQADASGNFEVPGLLPGDYQAVASLNSNFFDEQEITISADNQTLNFECLELGYDHFLSYHGVTDGQYQLLPEMGVGIKLSGEMLLGHDDDAFAKISFLAPFNAEDGSISVQLWRGSSLITEKAVTNFSDNTWKTVIFDNFVPIDPENEYYVGYQISANEGVLPAAYHDVGPQVDGGAYIRIGGNWTQLNSGSFNFNFCIQAVAISTNPSGSEEEIISPTRYSLNENYPNPFNPSTTISYNLAENSQVELIVYNLKGQKVRTLVSTTQDSGYHETVWNGKDDAGKNVSSGIYLYNLNIVERYTSTKKMILLK